MKALIALVLVCALAERGGAQMHRLNGHVDLGGAFTGGGDFANDDGYFARAGVSVPAGREVAFQLEASGFRHALDNHCIPATGVHCPPDFPNVGALTVDMVVEMTNPFAEHPIIAMLGGGPMRMSNVQIAPNTSFGADAGIEAVVARSAKTARGHALTLGAHILYVSHTDYGSFWVLPVTAGIRFW